MVCSQAMALLALGEVPQPGAHAMRDQIICRIRVYAALDDVAHLLRRKLSENREPQVIREEVVAQLIIGDVRASQHRRYEIGECQHHVFSHVEVEDTLPLSWPLGRNDLHVKVLKDWFEMGCAARRNGGAVWRSSPSRDRGMSSHQTNMCNRAHKYLAGVRRYGGAKWSDRGAPERTFLASDQQSNRTHGVCQRRCVFMVRAVPVLREEHRPPFLVFCDDSSLAQVIFSEWKKKEKLWGIKQSKYALIGFLFSKT